MAKYNPEQLDQYLTAMRASPEGAKYKPEDWSKYEQYVRDQYGETTGDKALRYGATGLSALGKGLDYLGGVTRTGIGAALSDKIDLSDVGRALKANPLSSSDMLGRMGMAEHGKLSDAFPSLYSDTGDEWLKLQRGGAADPTGRGAVGFVADAVLDPLNLLSMGGTAAAKQGARAAAEAAGRQVAKRGAMDVAKDALSAIGRPIDNILQGGGRKLYKSAFKDADRVALAHGKPPVSDLLFDKGIGGTANNVFDRSVNEMQALEKTRGKMLAEGDALGAKVDPARAMDQAGDDFLKLDVANRPTIRKSMEPVSDNIVEHMNLPPRNLTEATALKTDLYDSLRNNAFDQAAKSEPGERIVKSMANGLKEGVENAAEKVKPGLGQGIKQTNDEWGQLLTAAKSLENSAKSAAKKKYITDADVVSGLIALQGSGGPMMAAPAMLAKKGLDASRTTWARTRGGQLLNMMGHGHVIDPIARQMLLSNWPEDEKGKAPRSPWTLPPANEGQ